MIPGIPHVILIATDDLAPGMPAATAVDAIAAGLSGAGRPVDRCPLHDGIPHDFDVRLRAARTLICGTEHLTRDSLAGTLLAEVATRARQIGVPCHAVARVSQLSAFDARLLDLQTVTEASTPAALRKAGRRLAEVV